MFLLYFTLKLINARYLASYSCPAFIQDNIALNLVKSSSRNSKAPEVSRTIGNRNGCTFVRVCQDENMLQLASPGLQELPTIFIQTSNVNIFSICLNEYQVCFPFDNFSGLALRGHPWSTCAPRTKEGGASGIFSKVYREENNGWLVHGLNLFLLFTCPA